MYIYIYIERERDCPPNAWPHASGERATERRSSRSLMYYTYVVPVVYYYFRPVRCMFCVLFKCMYVWLFVVFCCLFTVVCVFVVLCAVVGA